MKCFNGPLLSNFWSKFWVREPTSVLLLGTLDHSCCCVHKNLFESALLCDSKKVWTISVGKILLELELIFCREAVLVVFYLRFPTFFIQDCKKTYFIIWCTFSASYADFIMVRTIPVGWIGPEQQLTKVGKMQILAFFGYFFSHLFLLTQLLVMTVMIVIKISFSICIAIEKKVWQ